MMMSLFNSFDYFLMLKMNLLCWSLILMFLVFKMLSLNYWWMLSMLMILNFSLMNNLMKLFSNTSVKFLNFNFMMYNLMFLMLFLNLMGMLPYIFPLSSRLELTLGAGFSSWLMMTMKSVDLNNSKIFYHLVPQDLSVNISGFLSLIELVSNLIRPLTISFRLSANITSGHIIFGMLSSSILFLLIMAMWNMMNLYLFIFYMFYMLFEFCIMIIQASVFILLLFLYQNEYY